MVHDEHLKPDRTQRPIDWLLLPFQSFARAEASSGVLLLVCTAAALVWANSPWRQSYFDFWHTYAGLTIGSFTLKASLQHWVNDALMAIFFFVVGLEIKREVIAGDLASFRKAAIPIAAAIGGMALPAIVYVLVNWGQATLRGWAIPAATDIAFALGVLALLGRRVPNSLKVLLTALAIVDDIGAVLIIALFYSGDLSLPALGAAGGIVVLLVLANILHVRWPLAFAVMGVGLWLALFYSGIHATIAGVVLALTIPARVRIRSAEFVTFARRAIDGFQERADATDNLLTNPVGQSAVQALEEACEDVQTPLVRLEHALHPWVAYVIMPVFALANAGVALGGDLLAALVSAPALGVILGLVVGKQVGVTLFAYLAIRSRVGALPAGSTWRQVYGAGWLAGIGFTMSLFIAGLAFAERPALLDAAKIGILAGSLVSGMGGFVILRFTSEPRS
jgi:NhaA family Na+:H+ antiporter